MWKSEDIKLTEGSDPACRLQAISKRPPGLPAEHITRTVSPTLTVTSGSDTWCEKFIIQVCNRMQ